MLNHSVDVRFSYSNGLYARTLKCDFVEFGMTFLGEVEEDLNFDLIEDYESVRMQIRLKVRLSFAETLYVADFLASTSKVLTIDGVNIEVVNDMKDIDFKLVEKSSFAAITELRFKKRSIGLANMGAGSFGATGHIGNVGVATS